MPNNNQDLFNLYEKLPSNLKEALFSVDTAEAIFEIGRKYGLKIDEIGELGSETGLVILGVTHPRNFINKLSSTLKIPQEKARDIAKEINQKIFYPIRENLKEIHGLTEERPLEEKIIEVPPKLSPPSPLAGRPEISEIVPPRPIPTRPPIPQTPIPIKPAPSPPAPAETIREIEEAEKAQPIPRRIDPYREPLE